MLPELGGCFQELGLLARLFRSLQRDVEGQAGSAWWGSRNIVLSLAAPELIGVESVNEAIASRSRKVPLNHNNNEGGFFCFFCFSLFVLFLFLFPAGGRWRHVLWIPVLRALMVGNVKSVNHSVQ